MKKKPNEINVIIKNKRQVHWRIGLVYPNNYQVGMSGLTVKLLYHLLNLHPNIYCERIFLPQGRSNDRRGLLPRSIETYSLMRDFDILAFTFQFELDYINALKMLINSGISPFAIERQQQPLLIAGGPAITDNPKPLLKFFDLFFFGDFDSVCIDFLNTLINNNSDKTLKDIILDINGFNSIDKPVKKWKTHRTISLDEIDFPTAQVRPLEDGKRETKKQALNGFFLQPSRGCNHRCRFCLIGHIFSPFRERSIETLKELSLLGTKQTKTNFISLIGSAVADYSKILELLSFFNEKKIHFSMPSVRIDASVPLLEEIRRSGQWNITIAPETAIEDLRFSINKNITDNQIDLFLQKIDQVGLTQIKTYFILGLSPNPLEEAEAVKEFVLKTQQLYQKLRIHVSVTPLVPKPKAKLVNPDISYQQIEMARKKLSKDLTKNKTSFKTFPVEWAAVQGILSIGDQDLTEIILTVAKTGGSMQSWKNALNTKPSDFFQLYYNQKKPFN